MKLVWCLIIVVSIAAACGRSDAAKAKVFERKELNNDQLLIHYTYRVDNKTFTDSATVTNKVIPTDSINIVVDPQNPGKSFPDFNQ